MPKVCLNMIVKNEAKNLPRLFDSLKDIIDDYVIVDTGSTDSTKEIIKEYWNKLNIKGHVEVVPFKNFAYNFCNLHALLIPILIGQLTLNIGFQ